MNWRRTKAIARKELLHIVRDIRSLILALLLPFVMLVLFGYALSLDVDKIPTIVYDRDHTAESRELIRQFSGTPYFNIIGYAESPADIDRSVDRSQVLLGLVINQDFGKDLRAGREAPVQLLFDGSDSNTASIALGYADALVQNYAFTLKSDAQIKKGGGELKNIVEPRIRVWYNSDLKSRNYIVPGLIAVILMIIASLLTSLTIAREWETGTMEQLLSTPVRPSELVLGKLSAFFVLGLTDLLVCLIAGVFVFDVPLRGSVLLLLASSGLFLFGALCWGVFISASTRSQLIAYQMGTLTSFLPAFLLSGFIYSIENMPVVIQVVSHVVPARYFVSLLKAIFLKGVGWQALWSELLFLLAYAVIVFVLASRKMRQKIA
ncbi:MAG: ABC transporter permease [Acidobacteria bacterium]|nr:ABC transporter permease [Acidobacteriota bacterium]